MAAVIALQHAWLAFQLAKGLIGTLRTDDTVWKTPGEQRFSH